MNISKLITIGFILTLSRYFLVYKIGTGFWWLLPRGPHLMRWFNSAKSEQHLLWKPTAVSGQVELEVSLIFRDWNLGSLSNRSCTIKPWMSLAFQMVCVVCDWRTNYIPLPLDTWSFSIGCNIAAIGGLMYLLKKGRTIKTDKLCC